MSKRLILVLALAFVLGLSAGAYAEVQNVKLSGDITVYGISRHLSLTSQQSENTMASIVRVRVDADLTDNVMATVRLINERYWGDSYQVKDYNGDNNTEIGLDLAYVTLKEFLYSPLTLTIGRQEMHFGNDMIIGDPYTNNKASKDSVFNKTIDPDLSMRKSFDAIRATLNYDPLVIDLAISQIKQNQRTAPWGTASILDQDDQETLYGGNASYALTKNTTLEAYAWERRIGKKTNSSVNKVDRTDVVGGRIVTKPIENLTYQLEAAFQFGEKVNAAIPFTQRRRAWALETAATYDFSNTKKIGKYKPMGTLLFAHFSGNRGSGEKVNGAWDPMYENQSFGSIANNLFNQSNSTLLGAILSVKPLDDVTLKGEYYAYWWDKRFGLDTSALATATGETLKMTAKKFAGQEIDITATYDYTEDVQFSLLGGVLIPGASFSKENRNTAGELIGSMKVTF